MAAYEENRKLSDKYEVLCMKYDDLMESRNKLTACERDDLQAEMTVKALLNTDLLAKKIVDDAKAEARQIVSDAKKEAAGFIIKTNNIVRQVYEKIEQTEDADAMQSIIHESASDDVDGAICHDAVDVDKAEDFMVICEEPHAASESAVGGGAVVNSEASKTQSEIKQQTQWQWLTKKRTA